MSIVFKKPGIYSTVQDLGRFGFRRYGINPNGAMDHSAVRMLNLILRNPETSPVIEMYYPAAEIEFETETIFAIGGADFDAQLDGISIGNFRQYKADCGSRLSFKQRNSGMIVYFAARGGFDKDKVFGSSSTNLTARFGGIDGRKIKAGDRLELNNFPKQPITDRHSGVSRDLYSINKNCSEIRFTRGGEFEQLTALGEEYLLSSLFEVTKDTNRMGMRLSGKAIFLQEHKEMISAGTAFGTMQLLPDGQLIVLMADHQTTGGYPRIGNVISTDLPKLAQVEIGQQISFLCVSRREAEDAYLDHEKELNMLRVALSFY